MKEIDQKELDEGFIVEHEHAITYTVIEAYLKRTGGLPSMQKFVEMIARDHLREHPDYYTRLKEAGL